MLIGQKGVKYGLQVRAPSNAKPAAPAVKKRSVFGDEDSEEEAEDNVEQQIARQAARKQTDKKVNGCGECSRTWLPLHGSSSCCCPPLLPPPAWTSTVCPPQL